MAKLKKSKTYSIEYGKEKKHGLNVLLFVGAVLTTAFIIIGVKLCLTGSVLPFEKNMASFFNSVISYRMHKLPLIHDFFADDGHISLVYILNLLIIVFLMIWLIFKVFLKRPRAALTVFCFTGIFLIMIGLFMPTDIAKKADEKWTAAGQGIRNLIENNKYHKGAPVCEGDFAKKAGLELSKGTAFIVKMKNPQPYYLRGYIGEKYNGRGWEPLGADQLIKYNDLFRSLHKENFDGRRILADAWFDTGNKKNINNIEIENKSCNRRYFYLPYETMELKAAYMDLIGDATYISPNGDISLKYKAKAIDYSIDDLWNLKKELARYSEREGEFLKKEYNYRVFCMENYCALSKDAEESISKFLGETGETGKSRKKTVSQVKKLILEKTADFKYDENLVYVKEDGDFVSDFIKKKSGYSIHFSTLAACIFRYYRIPARFVEGYLIREADCKGKKSYKRIKLSQESYHTWMEYYEEGLGWVPFEATPTYIGIMKSDNKYLYSPEPMEKERIHKQKHKEETHNKLINHEAKLNKSASVILILLIIALLYAIYKLVRKKIRKFEGDKYRKRDINSKDNKRAIFAMMHIIRKMEKKGKLNEEALKEAETIYQEARYSNHEITREKRDKMKNLYEILKKTVATVLCLVLVTSLWSCKAKVQGLNEAERRTSAFVLNKIEEVGGTGYGDEWIMTDMALTKESVSNEIFQTYLKNLEKTVSDKQGILNTSTGYKYTEYSRIIIALNALKKTQNMGNPKDLAGYNLLEKLTDLDNVKRQGVNGTVWALIAFDSGRDEIPKSTSQNPVTRNSLIKEILKERLKDGGWNVMGDKADVDMTAMALQALAPYYMGKKNDSGLLNQVDKNTVKLIKKAVDKGVELLSQMRTDSGGYESMGVTNSESTVQVIVALSALGIDCTKDERFNKDGKNPLTALLLFQNPDGSFSHIESDGGNMMATEQALYGLIAYRKFKEQGERLWEFN